MFCCPRIKLDVDLHRGRLALVVELTPIIETTAEPMPAPRSLPPAPSGNVIPFPFRRQTVGA